MAQLAHLKGIRVGVLLDVVLRRDGLCRGLRIGLRCSLEFLLRLQKGQPVNTAFITRGMQNTRRGYNIIFTEDKT